ncbi:MAG: acyl-CoA dehydratase activase [Armatimonadota bacterium]
MVTAGIDVGSLTAKAVIMEYETRRVIGSHLMPTGHDPSRSGLRVLSGALDAAGICADDIHASVGTGYGRVAIEGVDWRITEISCHARGAWHIEPGTKTVIDIGGQDAKVIRVDDRGNALDFQMNDRCAAGTGRFFEIMADAMEIDLADFGDLAVSSDSPAELSSTCTVFAESEVVGLLAEGRALSDIAAGLCDAVARRIVAMANRLDIEPPLVLCGGVARNRGVREALQRHLGTRVVVPDVPQLVGALGAAVLAGEKAQK